MQGSDVVVNVREALRGELREVRIDLSRSEVLRSNIKSLTGVLEKWSGEEKAKAEAEVKRLGLELAKIPEKFVTFFVRPESDALEEALMECRRTVQYEFELSDKQYEELAGRFARRAVEGKGEDEGEERIEGGDPSTPPTKEVGVAQDDAVGFNEWQVMGRFLNLRNHTMILHRVVDAKGAVVFRSLEEVRELPSTTVQKLVQAMAEQSREIGTLGELQPSE